MGILGPDRPSWCAGFSGLASGFGVLGCWGVLVLKPWVRVAVLVFRVFRVEAWSIAPTRHNQP